MLRLDRSSSVSERALSLCWSGTRLEAISEIGSQTEQFGSSGQLYAWTDPEVVIFQTDEADHQSSKSNKSASRHC